MWDFISKSLDASARFGLVLLLGGLAVLWLDAAGLLSLSVQGYPWVRSVVVGSTALAGAAVTVAALFLGMTGVRLLFAKLSGVLTSRAEARGVDEEALANVKITDDEERLYLMTQFRREQDRFATDHWDDAIEGLKNKRIIDHPPAAGGDVWVIRPCVWALREELMQEWRDLPNSVPRGLVPKAERRSRFGGF